MPKVAKGWICADSRYVLYINGQRVQFGPAPFDPRHPEADPIDLAPYLVKGRNCIGVHVLFYGHGDGTWPTGKPGLILRAQAGREVIATDQTWSSSVDRAMKPGSHKRWFLRALQETDDARLWPQGWCFAGYREDRYWYQAIELDASPEQATVTGTYNNYLEDTDFEDHWRSTLRPRSIPMIRELLVDSRRTFEGTVEWTGNPNDYWDFGTPNLFEVKPAELKDALHEGSYVIHYELRECMTGWPIVYLDTSSGVIVEVSMQESVTPNQTWISPKFHGYSRHITMQGDYSFTTFDYETGGYIQLHIDVPKGAHCRIRAVRFKRRRMILDIEPSTQTNIAPIDSVLTAAHNSLVNSCQDVVVDGMARERQQYSGDGSHQLHAARQAHGLASISKRFLRTFAHGQMLNGVWFDSWPGYDRYARVGQRQIGATKWGPLVDHSIGFVCDHVHHWLQTGDREPYVENKAKILKFLGYLDTIRDDHGMLRCHSLGAEAVWMDHEAYKTQEQKQLALNLYEAYMHSLLAMIDGLEPRIDPSLKQNIDRFLKDGKLVNNPFAKTKHEIDDRALAHFIWLNANTEWDHEALPAAINALVNRKCTHSYPANSVWRHWAYAQVGRVDLILDELRTKWRNMNSIGECNTLSEFWSASPNTNDLMSHCAVSPTIMMHQAVLGLGNFRDGKLRLRPQLANLHKFAIKSHTPKGVIEFGAEKAGETHLCHLTKPKGLELILCSPIPLDHPALDFDFESDFENEFRYDLTDIDVLENFQIDPYPQNQLILE
ncbi:MAG: hypothetical protein CBB60_003295 [Armatimonadetes bacterium Cent15-Ar3]|nr:MAG: hypothetical protein CBB60_003295 [Armatimonadetes bacterium Cent15-Ar3]